MFIKINSNKGQALVEMSIMGIIILFIAGVLLSYLQQTRDQQYVQMESFRRGLAYASMFPIIDAGIGAGASVDYSVTRNKRYVDLSNNYRKGEPQTVSASSSIYWAVPKVGLSSWNLAVYRVNEDENPINLASLFGGIDILSDSDIGQYISFSMENIDSAATSTFRELKEKNEDSDKISTTRRSALNEEITTTIYSAFRPRIPIDTDDDTEAALTEWLEGQLGQEFNVRIPEWVVAQRLYRKADGQYGYSSLVPAGSEVVRGRAWETQH
ncbi:MAG: hypothetical protein C4533_08180 [Candidatus Omnitrophota bacterium]|jgi:hypothetical protein|nr:MAG: hypothetical protein C4533_08180 [Candidatus Omnitrophota bacterium]